MKKYILILIIIFLVFIFIFGCAEEKTYKVFVGKYKPYINESSNNALSDSSLFSKLNELNKYNFKTYCAKEIISFTDKSVRFIDKEGNEQFISGDRIKIEQIK